MEDPFSGEETVIVFDWDDTLLCTTFLQQNGLRLDAESEVTQEQREKLGELAFSGIELLCAAKAFGTVVVVTNGENGWIELSCQKFMPALAPLLESVKLVSARSTYEGPDNPSPLCWKMRAFESELARIFGVRVLASPDKRKNMLSLGDGVHEREALMRCAASVPNCCAKTLKFVERPSIAQLMQQHSLVRRSLESIVHHDGSLDLVLSCD